MIKYLVYIFTILLFPYISVAGPSIVGTRFILDSNTKALNIKIINDDENDYLIKTTINSDAFIISPPLFVLLKSESNLITIIPNGINKYNSDKIYDLVVTAIPRSEKNTNDNTVSLAVRSHFKLIYRHRNPDNADFDKIKLFSDSKGEYWLRNNSDIAFDISFSTNVKSKDYHRSILSPNTMIPVKGCRLTLQCKAQINFFDSNDTIIKSLSLFDNK